MFDKLAYKRWYSIWILNEVIHLFHSNTYASNCQNPINRQYTRVHCKKQMFVNIEESDKTVTVIDKNFGTIFDTHECVLMIPGVHSFFLMNA